MNSEKLPFLIIFLFALVIILFSTFYKVSETQQALVLQFGEAMRTVREPGLNYKIPFVQNVIKFDKRILDVDPPGQQVILKKEKRLDVDAYGRYRIVDPLKFYQAVGSERGVESRLSQVINSSIRDVLVEKTLTDVLSSQRTQIMNHIKKNVIDDSKNFGVEIIDVRIRRADYPKQVSEAIYERMRSIWEREAKLFRAEGEEEARRIRAEADKMETVIIAEANKKSQIIRGEGEAKATKIYADAYRKSPDFFSFYRSLEAYKNTLKEENGTSFVLSSDNEFFKYLGGK